MPVKKYQEFIPHVTLQDSVKRFWILEKEYTAADDIEEVIPDPCVELIFNFGTAFSLGWIIRFEAIRNRLMSDANANLTDLAYEFGYTDQAHFIKDFKTFTDRTPGEYALELEQFQKMFRDHKNVLA